MCHDFLTEVSAGFGETRTWHRHGDRGHRHGDRRSRVHPDVSAQPAVPSIRVISDAKTFARRERKLGNKVAWPGGIAAAAAATSSASAKAVAVAGRLTVRMQNAQN